jgi:NAD(P)-binding Rossmann-like domain
MAAAAAEYFRNLAASVTDPVAGTTAYKNKDDLAYQLSSVPLKTPRPLKIIFAGAGISGLSFAHELNTGGAMQNVSLTIYEKNAGVGGTWYENRYPG